MFIQNKGLIYKVLLLLLIVSTAFACGIENENPSFNENEIISFDFLALDNEGLEFDVIGKIDRSANTIVLDLPLRVEKTHLFPSISVSDGAIISPDANQAFDFSKQIRFTVSANGISRDYTVKVNNIEFLKSRILKFDFVKAKNSNLNSDVNGVVNHDSQYIYISPPCGTVGTKFVPSIEISEGSKISPTSGKEQDFQNGIVYTVTSSEGEVNKYKVALANESSDRKALIDFYLANPDSKLDWNIEAPMDAWRGIELKNCRVDKIFLTRQQIQHIPNSFGDLSELTELTIANSPIENIPAELGKFKKLKILQLVHNQLKAIPEELGNMESIEYIYFTGNKIEEIPVSLGRLQHLIGLHLDNNMITVIPSEFLASSRNRIEYLNLSFNQLKEIPKEISSMSQLRRLYLSANLLEQLPPEIGSIKYLNELIVNGNKLRELPEEIVNLQTLVNLQLVENELTSLPQKMERLSSLIQLNLQRNKFVSVPVQVSKLPVINYLRFSYNQLATIPPEIGNLNSLSSLWLDNNELREIPVELSKLTKIKYLSMWANKMVSIPQAVCDLRKNGSDVYVDSGVLCK